MAEELHRIDTRLPHSVVERIDAAAKRHNVSRGYAMRMAIACGLREVELMDQSDPLYLHMPRRVREMSGPRY